MSDLSGALPGRGARNRATRVKPDAGRPCFVAFTWAVSTRGDVLPRSAGTFTTVEEARQFLGRVRRTWLDDGEGWAVFKLPAESGRGTLVASGVVRDLTVRSYWASEPDLI